MDIFDAIKNNPEKGECGGPANARKTRGKWVTAIAYELAGVEKEEAFGSIIVRGCPPAGADKSHDWTCQKVHEHGVGLSKVEHLDFLQLSTSSMRV